VSVFVGWFVVLAATAHAQDVALEHDAYVISSLRRNGSDLSKPHDIDFFFYVPNESAAKGLASELMSAGYTVRHVQPSPQTPSWEVYVQRSMVPDLKRMQELTVKFSRLAGRFGGVYDGWGALSVK
jgi:hypothetical protein